jgi:hypothetical protein
MIILGTGALRWSSPTEFNDPFDIRRDFELPFTNDEFSDAIIARFEGYLRGEGVPGTPTSKLLLALLRHASKATPVSELLKELRATLAVTFKPLETARQQFRDIWTERVPGMRILCFSTDPESPTMWAHYAGNLSGAVLGFESSDERDSPWLLAKPVVYADKAPSLPSVDVWVKAFLGEERLDWEAYLTEYYYVKSTDWSYEKEYRVASDLRKGESGSISDYRFFEEDLREVILGPAFPENDVCTVCGLVEAKYPKAIVKRAVVDFKSRRVASSSKQSNTR